MCNGLLAGSRPLVVSLMGFYYCFSRRRITPPKPSKPAPNSESVAGSGTGATLVFMFPLEILAGLLKGYEPVMVNVVSAPKFVASQVVQPGKRMPAAAALMAPESGPVRV